MAIKSVAIAVEKTNNSKTGPCSATHAAQFSCSDSCALKPRDGEIGGCYANTGTQALATNGLNSHTGHDKNEIADIEAAAIRKLSGKSDLRAHVVGDCDTDYAAQTVSAAMADHESKTGKSSWTYTHSWRHVERSSWAIQNILASCETTADVKAAWARGYSAALVIADDNAGKSYTTDGVRVIVCPNELDSSIQCTVNCGLCLKSTLVNSRIGKSVIGFPAHSKDKAIVLETLKVLNS